MCATSSDTHGQAHAAWFCYGLECMVKHTNPPFDGHRDERNDEDGAKPGKEQCIDGDGLQRRGEALPVIRGKHCIPHHLCLVDHDLDERNARVLERYE